MELKTEWSVTKSDVAGVNFAVASGSKILTGTLRASAISNSVVTLARMSNPNRAGYPRHFGRTPDRRIEAPNQKAEYDPATNRR
jgi:hypothetical protein